MNIQMQVCGLIIILLLFFIYRMQRTLRLYQERLFLICLRSAVATLSTDILSVVGIYYSSQLPELLVQVLCRAYLVAIFLAGFAALFYVLLGAIPEKKRIRLFYILSGVTAAEVIAILVCPLRYVHEGGAIYTEGPAVILTYLFTILYICATLLVAVFCVRKNNGRRAMGVILWMGCWIVAAAIQYLHNDLLLVGFSGAIGMVILYIVIEMPEANRDKQFNCFNSYAFDVYCNEMREHDRRFSLMEINLLVDEVQNAAFHPIQTPMKIINLLRQINGVNVFKNVNYSLIVVSEDLAKLRTVYEQCRAFIEPHGMMHVVEFPVIEDNRDFTNSVELAMLLNYCRAQNADMAGKMFIIPTEQIQRFRNGTSIGREIRDAIRQDKVELYLQPIFSMITNRFDTAEVLARIRTKTGNILLPNDFIPAAEHDGIIHELGDRVMEQVCKFAVSTDLRQLGIRYLMVNLSGTQCEYDDTAERAIAVMKKYQVPAQLIYFEITETGAQSRSAVLKTVQKLQANGSKICIDRFGRGKSNLEQLMDLPATALKLDYELAKSCVDSERARHVIRNVVNLAHSLGMKAVAEGVENGEELEFFQRAGVDYVQGYYFARAMPVKDYCSFLENCVR